MRSSTFDDHACDDCHKNGVAKSGVTRFQWFRVADNELQCPTCGSVRKDVFADYSQWDLYGVCGLVEFAESIRMPWPEQGTTWKAPTGEKYVVLRDDGIKLEGEGFPVEDYSDTPEKAALRWKGWFARYVEGKPGTIYWRAKPEMQSHGGGYVVYSRLLISGQPVLNEFTEQGVADFWKDHTPKHIKTHSTTHGAGDFKYAYAGRVRQRSLNEALALFESFAKTRRAWENTGKTKWL